MDFDLSKENIQPLRGGRNVQQLGMALQAQTSREYQAELLHQQQEFENLIRTYEGDDPLENYYNYVSWIEQSYPKRGHEGNLIPLLETCLQLFENDKRYTNDRRYCKLLIKYFDTLPNPLESYQMAKSKGLCVGCTDMYKAWAYYYEAVGDFQSAHNVFEEGKKNLAQPYDELEIAHNNMIMAAGQHLLFGPDETRLQEKRHALTSLQTHHGGRVSSVRTPFTGGGGPGTLGAAVGVVGGVTNNNNNAASGAVRVYEGAGLQQAEAAAAAPASVIAAVRRQDVVKENELKPGPWATVPVKKRVVGDKGGPAFTVHCDVPDNPPPLAFSPTNVGIRLPKNHPRACLEDYSDFRVAISYPEAHNPAAVPMYPKARVYARPDTEFSIEEVRAERYPRGLPPPPSPQATPPQQPQAVFTTPRMKAEPEPLNGAECMQGSLHELKNDIQRSMQTPPKELSHRSVQQDSPMLHQNSMPNTSRVVKTEKHSPLQKSTSLKVQEQNSASEMRNPFTSWCLSPAKSDELNIWDTPPKKTTPPKANFQIFEQSLAEDQLKAPAKGSAMKTAFKDLNAEELAETGSRGGMDIAAIAHPTESASQNRNENVVDSPTTYTFNFNLNNMMVSTPQNKRSVTTCGQAEDVATGQVKKQLFAEPAKAVLPLPINKTVDKEKALSTILEETHPYASSSSSSGATTKSSLYPNQTNKVSTISEEHNSYLQQNMMVNAALRSSLLGNIMDLGTSPACPVTTPPPAPAAPMPSPMQCSPFESPARPVPIPKPTAPLEFVPSDPFKSSLINQLLERISFPGAHTYGYVELPFINKIVAKKEPVFIGQERYIVEKQLGKGTFGVVFKAFDLTNNRSVAIKYQKPANKWEYHICRELQARLAEHPLRDRFMDVSIGYFSDQASILISEFMPGGSLLDLANLHKQRERKPMKECLVVYFCIQMLQMVQAMHDVKIIHADIKPDNFLVFILPDNTIGLQLIDFGCGIDMSLFPADAAFTRAVTTEDFVCCEMLDGRPWNYHTDLFCVAATAHVLLFDSYIRLRKQDGLWSITQRFNRWMKVDLWNMFFSSLLNQQSGPTDTAILQAMLDETLCTLNKDSSTSLPNQMRYIVNLLKNQ